MKITQKISTIRYLASPYFRKYAGTILVVALMCTIIQIVPIFIVTTFWPKSDIALVIVEIYALVIGGPIAFSEAILFLSAFRNQCAGINSLAYGFGYFNKSLQLSVSIYLRAILGFVLFVVPGFIVLIKYSLAYYILADNPHYSVKHCLTESAKLMDGNKIKLAKLVLSYVPLWILCGVPRLIVGYLTIDLPLIVDEKAFMIAYNNALASPLCTLVGFLTLYAECKIMVGIACMYDIVSGKLIFNTDQPEEESI